MGFVAFITWIALAAFVGIYAGRLHRSKGQWTLLAFVFSPLMMWLLLAALGPGQPSAETHRQCADCLEWVPAQARKCKHCGAPAATTTSQATRPSPNLGASGISTGEFTG
jgi:hypothetical protein